MRLEAMTKFSYFTKRAHFDAVWLLSTVVVEGFGDRGFG